METRRPWGLAAFLLIAACAFASLGVWQVHRLHWKHALIARVDARVHAAPQALPPSDVLARQDKDRIEYLRVQLSGRYNPAQTALVRAATDLGTGYWTMSVLTLDDGRKVWINRGYLPSGTSVARAAASAPAGPVRIIGLLRLTEPKGSLLQSNQPKADRWYSRDVLALAQSRAAGRVEPVFVDAQREVAKTPAKGPQPVPGLTVIHFADNHLVYALTWFGLAILSIGAIFLAWRRSGSNVT